MELEGQRYLVKPMNCPFHIAIYRSQMRSYRDLPLRFAELGTVYRYERSGVITPRATLPFSDRLLAVYDGLLAVLDELKPDEVAVESAFVRKSALAALQIGHVRGVILLAARQRGAAIHEYTAPEVKLAVVRHGAAAKEQVAFMVRRLLPQVGPIREDEADALAVALCHAHRAPLLRMRAAR
jgi:crossover junction endodeoxyribonuclease RuvC